MKLRRVNMKNLKRCLPALCLANTLRARFHKNIYIYIKIAGLRTQSHRVIRFDLPFDSAHNGGEKQGEGELGDTARRDKI